MTAWKQGQDDAPKDRPILVRFAADECPVVMKYEVENDCWIWCDEFIRDACDPINSVEVTEFYWTLIPE